MVLETEKAHPVLQHAEEPEKPVEAKGLGTCIVTMEAPESWEPGALTGAGREFSLPSSPLICVAPSGLDDAHHIGEEGLLVSLMAQMLLSSGNILRHH